MNKERWQKLVNENERVTPVIDLERRNAIADAAAYINYLEAKCAQLQKHLTEAEHRELALQAQADGLL